MNGDKKIPDKLLDLPAVSNKVEEESKDEP
jgi:hypothetical protein